MGAADDLVWILAIIGWCWIGLIILGVLMSDLETAFWLLGLFVGIPFLLVSIGCFFYFLPCILNKHSFAKVSAYRNKEWVYLQHRCQQCGKTETRETSLMPRLTTK